MFPGPSPLRTVRADLPHTALRLVVLPQSGLASQCRGILKGQEPVLGKVGVWPAIVVSSPASSASFGSFAQDAPETHSDPGVDAVEGVSVAVFEVSKPTDEGSIDVLDDPVETVPVGASGFDTDRVFEFL